MPFGQSLRIAAFGAFLMLILSSAAVGMIQPGDTREDVVRELGESYSDMRFGAFETIQYKDGTRVSLQNGKVTVIEGGRQPVGSVRTGATATGAPDHSRTSKVVPKEVPPAPDRADSKVPPSKQSNNATPPASSSSSGDSKVPSPASQQLAQATGPITPTASTNLGPFSIVRKLGEHPMVISFSGSSSKAFSSVAALTPRLVWMARGASLALLGLLMSVYLFSSYCFGRICRKGGEEPGFVVWIPVAQFIPLMRVAQMPLWTLILLLIPLINLVVLLVLWAKICVALGKNPWLVVLWLVPVANLGLLAYLAFGGGTPQPPRLEHSFGTPKRQPEAVSV